MNRKSFIKVFGFSIVGAMMSIVDELETFLNTEKMPLLFLGHGSPMNAIEKNQFTDGFKNIGNTIPKPNAILCISAHWVTRGTSVTAMEIPKTIHDFGGFPRELFEVQYPAKGSPELAKLLKKTISSQNIELDTKWGLDHGTWSVVKHLYPDANIPVIQLSISATSDMKYHFELSEKLSFLREKGILIIGSGNIVHNLGMVDFQNFHLDNYGFDWALEARDIINKYIISEDFEPLINYQKLGKAVQYSIPTPEHYIPLLYILGLKTKNEKIQFFNDKMVAGSLSMTSLKII
jgi:4,5-DOPA dioxygenase extradiol